MSLREQTEEPKAKLISSCRLGGSWALQIRSGDTDRARSGYHHQVWLCSQGLVPTYIYIDSSYLDSISGLEYMASVAYKALFHLPGPHNAKDNK